MQWWEGGFGSLFLLSLKHKNILRHTRRNIYITLFLIVWWTWKGTVSATRNMCSYKNMYIHTHTHEQSWQWYNNGNKSSCLNRANLIYIAANNSAELVQDCGRFVWVFCNNNIKCRERRRRRKRRDGSTPRRKYKRNLGWIYNFFFPFGFPFLIIRLRKKRILKYNNELDDSQTHTQTNNSYRFFFKWWFSFCVFFIPWEKK